MASSSSSIARVLLQFPRGHLLISAGLALVVSLAAFLPESDASLSGTASRSLALPMPEQSPQTTPDQAEPAREWLELEVSPGDTLAKLLMAEGVTPRAIHELVTTNDTLARLADLRPGQQLRLDIAENGQLQALEYQPSDIQTLQAEYTPAGWQVTEQNRDYDRQLKYAEATIDSSLFMAGQDAGMTDNLTMQLANIFGWDVDFVLDIRQGDRFRVLYEELYLDGRKVRNGNILMAEFWNRDRHFTAFRFQRENGDVEYLDEEGNSMRREFIRTPVAFSRISSGFSLGRKHPILNKVRAHKGIDYAAPTGTPVKAAGDGKVIFAGRKGGYGNVVIIRHGQKFSTLYAHLHRFERGIRVGKRVRQGQTIARVGMSGLATGPHLHYEFRVNGVHRNPLTVPLPKARGIPDSERREFLVHAKTLRNQLALQAEAFTLASNDTP
jgi:murein DD-endopeptidase MepM/ murein hydrolase activator NlpD